MQHNIPWGGGGSGSGGGTPGAAAAAAAASARTVELMEGVLRENRVQSMQLALIAGQADNDPGKIRNDSDLQTLP